MTSIADTDHGAGKLPLPTSEPRPGRNFNLRAYLAGAGATTALIAGAIVVFASLGAYVAFNGLPVGSGSESAGQLTVGQASPVSGPLGRAAGAVAATAAASTATAPPAGETQGANGAGGGGASDPPGTVPTPGGPTGPTIDPTTNPPTGVIPTETGSGISGSGSGSVGAAVGGVSDATGLPLDDATDGIIGPVDSALDGVGDALGAEQAGQAAGDLAGSVLP